MNHNLFKIIQIETYSFMGNKELNEEQLILIQNYWKKKNKNNNYIGS